ncbi:hypothetical protein BJF78_32230 [Pseudonocardia sp. CNS-139]|nr:hypothetical protein BJF78_32230 [Pseudonocardia sp. CNS-139]
MAGAALSVPVNVNTAASSVPLGFGGVLTSCVSGGATSVSPGGGGVPAPQITPVHWSASALPLAVLPPPSTVPSAALMPHARLWCAALPVTVWPAPATDTPSPPLLLVVLPSTRLPSVGSPFGSRVSASTAMPSPAVPSARLPTIRLFPPACTEMPPAVEPDASLSCTSTPLVPASAMPPGLKRTSLPVTRPPVPSPMLIASPPAWCATLPTTSVPSEASTEIALSLARTTVLASTRFWCEPSASRIAASPVSDRLLPAMRLRLDCSSEMPPSLSSSGSPVRPLIVLSVTVLPSAATSCTAIPTLPANVLPVTVAASVPPVSVTPAPLSRKSLVRTVLPLRPLSASSSSAPARTLPRSTMFSTTL